MARTKVVVDPITRIEGHLRIEAQADNGKITKAWASSTQFRGIEIVMQGRDPRDAWAFTQRICGVCTAVHAVASCRAVEDALNIKIPANANTIRNLVTGMQFIQDHVVHFYHLHALDWVDVVSALSADPARDRGDRAIVVAVAEQRRGRVARRADPSQEVRRHRPTRDLHERLLGTSGVQAAARGEPARRVALPRGARLAARRHPSAHGVRRQESTSELPRRRYGVGDQSRQTATINAERITDITGMIARARAFVEQVYWPDLVAIAGFYKDWGAIGGGIRQLPRLWRVPRGRHPGRRQALFPRGVILDKDLTKVHEYDQSKIVRVHPQLVVRISEG